MASESRLFSIIDEVASTLSTVTGIGHIYKYLRWAVSDASFEAMGVTGGVVQFWQITRANTEERWLTTGQVWRAHTLAIYGALSLQDAEESERTFQALVERVANRFRSKEKWDLGGTVESTAPYMGPMAASSEMLGAKAGIQVESIEHRSMNNKLVHFCHLALGVQDKPEQLAD